MGAEPRGDGRDLTVRQQLDDLATLEVADDRFVALVAPKGPVVDADKAKGIGPGNEPGAV